jgi:hypothetical protein
MQSKVSWLGLSIFIGLVTLALLWFEPSAMKPGTKPQVAPVVPVARQIIPQATPSPLAPDEGATPSERLQVGRHPEKPRPPLPQKPVPAAPLTITPVQAPTPSRPPQLAPKLDGPAPTSYPKARPKPVLPTEVPQVAFSRSLEHQLDLAAAARQSSAQISKQMASGQLSIRFEGTGTSPAMVSLELENRGRKSMEVTLRPGMVLRPATDRVQPLLIRDEVRLTLQPGERQSLDLESYCMDSRIPAPAEGAEIDYRWSPPDRAENAGVVDFLERYEHYRADRRLMIQTAGLPLGYYPRVVLQIGVWSTLGQPIGDKQWRTLLGPWASHQDLRTEVLTDVARIRKYPKY